MTEAPVPKELTEMQERYDGLLYGFYDQLGFKPIAIPKLIQAHGHSPDVSVKNVTNINGVQLPTYLGAVIEHLFLGNPFTVEDLIIDTETIIIYAIDDTGDEADLQLKRSDCSARITAPTVADTSYKEYKLMSDALNLFEQINQISPSALVVDNI